MKIIKISQDSTNITEDPYQFEIDQIKDRIKELREEANIIGFQNEGFQETYDEYDQLRQKLKNLEFKQRNKGAKSMSLDERDEYLSRLSDLNKDVPFLKRTNIMGDTVDYHSRWRRSNEEIGQTKELGPKYKIESSGGYLFRGITIEDWERIQEQGFIDTDGRGAIMPEDEQINLTPNVETAAEYIPSGHQGVILAINPNGLDLYMIKADDYIRANHRIPLKNVVDVSEPIGKDSYMGSMYIPT